MGEAPAHLLENRLNGDVDLELRRRIEALLAKCSAASFLALRHHRAVATFEWIGSPDARALLQSLSEGPRLPV